MALLQQLKRSRIIHMCFAISFFTSGLILNMFELLAFVLVKPFSKRLYRQMMWYFCYGMFAQLVFMADWWAECKLYLYAKPEDITKSGKDHGLLIMNHTYEIDWLIGWKYCNMIGCLGNCKAYAKKVIQYIPVVGWAWKFAEFVFLERSFDKDKILIGKQLNEIFDYPDPVWLLLNAEGTRFTQEKHEASVKFAEQRGMTVLKHHLIPRSKGFTTSLPFMREKCKYIFDVQLVFKADDKVAPTLNSLLFGNPVTGHMYIECIDVSTVPENEEEAAEWLQNLFRQKDRMTESFHKHGDFFTSSGVPAVPRTEVKRRIHTLVNTLAWAVITLTPMLYYLTQLLISGELFYFSLGAGILLVFYVLMQQSIGVSKISHGSAYGAQMKKGEKVN